MRAFTTPIDALKAGMIMHQHLQELNQQLALLDKDRLVLIGIDVDPCIRVSLNERLDYFGTTVNTAARVQAISQGNDIAVTETFLADRSVAEVVKKYRSNSCNLLLKGLDAPIGVHLIELATEPL
jgi:class 3 adenylate cyclase